MAQPRREITTEVSYNENYYAVAGSMQGWRPAMEDRHAVLLGTPGDSQCMFFAVYDGHGGAEVADYAARRLHNRITLHRSYLRGDIETALHQSFLQIDHELINNYTIDANRVGSTALVVLIRGQELYVANLGDCRAIAGVQGGVVLLSRPHKPSIPNEKARIQRAGFTVEGGRIGGNLNISRTLGDFQYKINRNFPPTEQAIISVPEVRSEFITHDWSWVFLGSDGIWDCISPEALGVFINTRISSNLLPERIIRDLLNRCLAPNRYAVGNDNMTAVFIILLNNCSRQYHTILTKRYLRQHSPQPHYSKLRHMYH